MCARWLGCVCLTLLATSLAAQKALPEEAVPPQPSQVITKHCLGCHDTQTREGDVHLDLGTVDWSATAARQHWERVHRALHDKRMPPPEEVQPAAAERATLTDWIEGKLIRHTPIGGTLPRRLNQSEYQTTLRTLFELPDLELPPGMPSDTELHGFNNGAEGLVLSPLHLAAYARVARDIADELIPPVRGKPRPRRWEAGPEDMVLSFSASSVLGGAIRLASRAEDVMRSCTWPSKIEILDSGSYKITLDASKFLSPRGRPFDADMLLDVYARAVDASERSKIRHFRLLKQLHVAHEAPQQFVFDADLYEGETVLFHWKNAEMTHDPPDVGEAFEKISRGDAPFLAAWLKVVYPTENARKPARLSMLRGRNGWDAVVQAMEDLELDLGTTHPDTDLAQAFFRLAHKSGKTTIADCLCYYYHERGPALEIHRLTIEGPSKRVESPLDRARRARREKVLGVPDSGQTKREFARQMLSDFLPRAFRRPVSKETIERYLTIAHRHWNDGHDLDAGLHLLLRNILISPRFLYRSLGEGKLDDHDLAARLSFFLTGGPPDAELAKLARAGQLRGHLRREARRLLPKQATDHFVGDFTGQWLDTAKLADIMPDPKFRFTTGHILTARREVEHFFAAMLRENRPMTDFIDPDFTYTSPRFAKEVYGLVNANGNGAGSLARTTLPRGGRVGGLLGQSAIMMATANGVDTQPVLRGVWVLENLLGTSPPDPPEDVPALTPDTRAATTPRQLLAAHTKQAACAVCHQRIDPLGLVLENFDPVGRWRQTWPRSGKAIESSVVLDDGTPIADVVELKAWLVANIDLFSQCLGEKLLTYATGRAPNFRERKEVTALVRANRKSQGGFRDFLLALIESETFRTH